MSFVLRTQPDVRLAKLAGEGSKPAFEELVRRHRSALVGFAARFTSPDRADDVVQDAVLKAYFALARGDSVDSPRSWLFQIVRNTALNEIRGHRSFEHLDENYDGVEQPPEAAERRRQLASMVSALGELPDAQRTAIVQRELEGRGHREIATKLGLTEGAVRQLIYRARDTLRTAAGALIPIHALRMLAISGNAEPLAGGAAGAGIGATAAKIGVGAVLATGAVVGGTEIEPVLEPAVDSPAVAAAAPASKAASGKANKETQSDARRDSGSRADRRRPTPERDHRSDPRHRPPPDHGGDGHHGGGDRGPGDGHHGAGDATQPGAGGGHHPGGGDQQYSGATGTQASQPPPSGDQTAQPTVDPSQPAPTAPAPTP